MIDIDSFVGEVYGYDKQGAGYGIRTERGPATLPGGSANGPPERQNA
jgi:hypothetical protein